MLDVNTTSVDLTLLPNLPNDSYYGDGKPFCTSMVRDHIRTANNMVSYKTATHMPFISDSFGAKPVSAVSPATHQVVFCFLYYLFVRSRNPCP